MPELRKDPIMGRWVIVASERARRPGIFFSKEKIDDEGACPFCPGHEAMTPSEICAIRAAQTPPNQPGWKVRVIPSHNPLLRIEGQENRRGHGLYDVTDGIGAHEVVIETPEHVANMADLDVPQIKQVLETYITRINDLENDPRFRYVLPYKNYGPSAGGGKFKHARSQLIATPITPMRVKEELMEAKRYYEFHERCVFCDMIYQETEKAVRVINQNEHFVALTPFASRFPFETWILPKKHHCDFAKGAFGLEEPLAVILKDILLRIKVGLDDPPYNFVFHFAPFRREKSRGLKWKTIEEDFHWHIEVIPRLTHMAGFEKGTGFYICSIPPEHTAEYLREVEL